MNYTLLQNTAGEFYIAEDGAGSWTYEFQQIFESGGINYWLVINPNAYLSPIRYDGGRDAYACEIYDWHYAAWYSIPKEDRQRYFRQGNKMNWSKTELCDPCPSTSGIGTLGNYAPAYYPPVQGYAIPEDIWYAKEGNNPMYPTTSKSANLGISAIATVETKTDLQTQRDYLLGRWRDVDSEFDRHYGKIAAAMRKAFNIDMNSERPKTAAEFLAAVASGKIKLDTKKQALQDIAISNDEGFETDDGWVSTHDMLYALDFGDPAPDRAGYETARETFRNSLKLLKDQIMTGDPASSVTALQALEAWTPPAAAKAN